MRDEGSEDGHLPHVASHDGRFARLIAGGDEPVFIDDRDDIQIGAEVRLPSDVALRAI